MFPTDIIVENQWQDSVDGKWVNVVAGALRYDDRQGFVEVFRYSGEHLLSDQRYLTPIKAGGVKLIRVNGLRFTLVSKQGAVFVFDLPTGQLTLLSGPQTPTPRT